MGTFFFLTVTDEDIVLLSSLKYWQFLLMMNILTCVQSCTERNHLTIGGTVSETASILCYGVNSNGALHDQRPVFFTRSPQAIIKLNKTQRLSNAGLDRFDEYHILQLYLLFGNHTEATLLLLHQKSITERIWLSHYLTISLWNLRPNFHS